MVSDLINAFKPSNGSDNSIKITNDVYSSILEGLYETYKAKNAMYGDSFTESINRFGNTAALTRMYDKVNRIITLSKMDKNQIKFESLADSVLDLANYSIMFHSVVDGSTYSTASSKVSAVINQLKIVQDAYSSTAQFVKLIELHFNLLCEAKDSEDYKSLRNLTMLLASYCILLYNKIKQ